jgi:electron transport complex protein RnfA
MFVRTFTGALMALTAENLLFSGGAGFSRALRAARKPSSAVHSALFVTGFSLGSGLAGYWLAPFFSGFKQIAYPAVVASAVAVFYLAAAALLRRLAPGYFQKHSSSLALAAVNTVILAIPFVQQTLGFGFSSTVGYALGTGVAFFLAVLLLNQALRICSGPDMPRAFSGLPGVLIYIGIVSMAFAGFSGRVF